VADLLIQLQAALTDRYRLDRELGRGGMATVYLAHDLKHDRPVALKVLHPELAATLGPDRFQREVRTTARLQHPHILPVLDSGEAAGQLWYTMPYVEGESLGDRLRRERQLPLDDALQITREVADALGYAHSQGIVHRDIKPGNILLSRGHALVADFGIARALQAMDAEHLTATGVAVGTPAYMSPEQADGASGVDGRSDLYSLGCVLYEMLTGEPPYMGTTPQAIMTKRFMDPVPSARRLRETIPEGVDQALQRVLAKAPADRFSTAHEFVRALAMPNVPLATPAAMPAYTSSMVSASTDRSERARSRHWKRVPLAATALGLGFLIGLGVLFAWRRSHAGVGGAGGAKVLAVLPFENLGDSAEAYFADGLANDLRTELSQVPGLTVIARGSSNEYKRTTKTQQQIARELGVNYLLSATVQWERVAGGASRVRVTPELVDVHPGHAPQTRWGQQFDAAVTDVFQVQSDIAGQVVQALNVALGDSAKQELVSKPTQSLPAYEAFLRGEAASQGMSVGDPPSLRQAIAAYEQAVALDSTFVRAWAQLARARARLYGSTLSNPAVAEAARRAAERALALAPTRPEGHQALGLYYLVMRDHPRAFTEDSTALALASGNAELLANVGQDEATLGRWEAARGHIEQAARLDPRSSIPVLFLGLNLLYTRRYPEAERTLDHALQLVPANLAVRHYRVMVALAQGDLPGAQAVLRATPKEVDPTALVQFVATYNDLMWVLDDAQQRLLLRLTPSAFDDDRSEWGSALAQTYALRGDSAKARAYADSARLAFEQLLRTAPQNASLHVFLGVILAYLGQKAAAIREGKLGVRLLPISRDALEGAYLQHYLGRIYILVGEPEKALDQLEPLLKIPYYLSPGWLKIDPNFAPLRGNPRFERLVRGTQ
jgi:eukaryotic-like serine/threonine-protein kinase